MGGYGYEIFGGILIVLSSLVGEEMKPKWKVGFYVFFAIVAIAYSGIGIYLRRDANVKQRAEQQERKDELDGVRRDLSNLLAASSGLGPAIASLNADVAVMRRDLETAKVNHNPSAIADLEAKADAAQKRVDNVSKALLGAMVPGTVRELRSWKGSWSSPEGKALILNIYYLQMGLLQGVQRTPEDTAASALFVSANGSYPDWNAERAAQYLESLVRRLTITMPPQDLSGTTQ